jgi:hypothetical protein
VDVVSEAQVFLTLNRMPDTEPIQPCPSREVTALQPGFLPLNISGESKRGAAPLLLISPSPFKERGIKGVRLIIN